MANHTGKALIITDDSEITVTVSLTFTTTGGGLTDWRGVVSGSKEAFWPLRNTTQARIRLDNGQEADLLITDPSQACTGRKWRIGPGLGVHAARWYSLFRAPRRCRRWMRSGGVGKGITLFGSFGARRSSPVPWWLRPVL